MSDPGHYFGDGCTEPHGRANVVPLDVEAVIDSLGASTDRHPSRGWRHAVAGNTLVGAARAQAKSKWYPRRNVSFGMHPDEARPIYDFARADGVTMACWLRRLVRDELRRRGIADERMPWLVASCEIPDQRHAWPPPETRARREFWQ